jgi:hypothetical protein
MKRLGRDAAELTALADHLTAHGLVLENARRTPAGDVRPEWAGSAAVRVLRGDVGDRAGVDAGGLDTAARKGKHGGRPSVITEDMLHTVLRRRAGGESVEQIQPDLIMPTGKRKGQSPSVASIYRALAEHEKAQAYPEAIAQARTDFAVLQNADVPRPRPDAEIASARP